MAGIRLSLLSILLLIPGRAQAAEPLVFRGKTLEQWRADVLSAHPEVRRRAAMALGLGPFGNSAVPPLLEAMKDENIRAIAVVSLSHLGPQAPDAAPALIPFVNLSSDLFDRDSPVVAASCIATSRLPLLLERARQELRERGGVSHSFLRGVDPSAVAFLRSALRDNAPAIRVAAACALARLGEEAADAGPDLLARLQDEDGLVRILATEALGEIRFRQAVPALEAILIGEAKFSAASALSRLGPPGLDALRRAYHGGSEELRLPILRHVADAGPAALPLLLEGLRHEDGDLRESTARGIATCGAAVDREIPRLIALLDDANPQVRIAILATLREVVPPRRDVVLAIAGRLADNCGKVSNKARDALCQLGRHARPAVPILLARLRHRDKEARIEALKLLAAVALPDREVVLALCDSLKDDCSLVREFAIEALASFGPQTRTVTSTAGDKTAEVVVAALLKALRDREMGVRINAASALLKIGYSSDHVIIEQLGQEILAPRQRLLGEQPCSARWAASETLQGLGPKSAPAMPLLMLALYAGDAAAIEPLGAMGPAARRAIPAFERLLNRTRDKEELRLSVSALLRIGGEGPRIVRARLNGEDEQLTVGLLAGLRSAGVAAKEFRANFLRLLQHSSEEVRAAAIDALHAIGARGEDVRAMLIRALRDKNEEVRLASARALSAMGLEAKLAIPVLAELLIDPRAECRRAVVEALGRINPNDQQGFTALVETLTDPDEGVRKAAIGALGGAGTDAVPALRSACRDQRESVRVASACALWRVKDQQDEARRILRDVMLDGKKVDARVEACKALWKLERTREVVPVLCMLLRDGPDRSKALIETLCNLDGARDDVRAFLKPLLRHELRAVRVAAWQVLDRIAPDLTAALADCHPVDSTR